MTNTFPWDSVVCVGILSLLHGLQGFFILCPHFPFYPDCTINTKTDGAFPPLCLNFPLCFGATLLFHSAVRPGTLLCVLFRVPRLAGQSDFWIGIFDSASANNARRSMPHGISFCFQDSAASFRFLRPEILLQKNRHLTFELRSRSKIVHKLKKNRL